MPRLLRLLSILATRPFRSRRDLLLENLTLRQQLAVLKQRHPQPGFATFDRATDFNEEVVHTIKALGIEPKRTSFRSPWQNGVAERWVGNCRRDLLDHVIVLNQPHLKRLMNEYVRYYHNDRTHLHSRRERLLVAK